MNVECVLRKVFTPGFGSRVRTAVRGVLPALVLLGVVELSAEQIAAVVVAIESVFLAGGEATRRV